MENVHQESPQGDVHCASVPPGDEPSQSTVQEEASWSKSELPPIDDTTSSDIAALVKQSDDFAEADVSNKEQRDTVRDTDGDSENDKEETDSDTSSLPPTSTTPITKTRGRKRGAAAPASSLQARVKTEPQEESSCMDSTAPVVAASEDEGEEAEEVEPHRRKRSERSERTLPTAAGVSTRRSKSDEQEQQMQKVDKSEKEEGPRQRTRVKREERSRSHSSRNSNRGRSHSSGSRSHNNNSSRSSSSSSSSDGDDDPEPSASTSTPRTSFRDASLASSTTQPNTSAKNCSASSVSTSAASAATRAKHDEALEATTQAAIQAQERQLRHTLLSIFPPHLRAGEATFTQRSATERAETAQPKSAATKPHAHRCSPEPLLPLLHALCEDKAFVHAAWCRYRDDLAVQRVQNSIQRKRQRHSFSKGSRRPTSTSVGASAVGATKLHRRGTASAKLHDDAASDAVAAAMTTDEEDEAEEDAHQPPESEWVEAAPGLTGPPRPMPAVTASISPQRGGTNSLAGGTPASTTATHASAPRAGGELVSGSAEAAVACGFQWTPWRFYREKRRRSTSTNNGIINVNSTNIGNNNSNSHDTHTSGRRVQAGSAGAAGNAAGTASPSTLHASTAAQHSSGVAPGTAKASDTAFTGVNSTAVHAAAGNGTPAASDLVGVAATPTATSTATVMASVSGGVPPLLFSEVPSLPVLQVEADVPEDPMAPVEAMTAEEQKNYARYVMSSGKLRNVCRDPYSFLVSRAKEMRIQWERQHPFE